MKSSIECNELIYMVESYKSFFKDFDYMKLPQHIFDETGGKMEYIPRKKRVYLSELDKYNEIESIKNTIAGIKEVFHLDQLINHGGKDDIFLFIKEFIKYIKFCEIAYFYNNDDTNDLFAAIDEDDNIYSLKITKDDYTIIYKIQESAINLPSDNISNPLLSFMNSNAESGNAIFIDIEVMRHYGVKETNKFSLLIGSNSVSFKSAAEKVLFNNILTIITKKAILQSIYDTLDNTYSFIRYGNTDIRVKDVLYHGENIYIRRS